MHKSFAHHHRRSQHIHTYTELIEKLVNLHVLIFGVVELLKHARISFFRVRDISYI